MNNLNPIGLYSNKFNDQAFLFTILFSLFLFIIFLLFKYSDSYIIFFKRVFHKKFKSLDGPTKEKFLKSSWCKHCGLTEMVNYNEVEIDREYIISGDCKKCNEKIFRRLS